MTLRYVHPSRPVDRMRRAGQQVPEPLQFAAGWTWRLIVIAVAAYFLTYLFNLLYLVVLPFIGAMLVTALVHPVVAWLRRRGLGRALSTWLTIIVGFGVLGGVFYFIAYRISTQYASLSDQVAHIISQGRDLLVNKLHVPPSRIDHVRSELVNLLEQHRSTVVSGVFTGLTALGEAVTGALLAFFSGFFLLYDGDRIWGWLAGLFPSQSRERVNAAGREAWQRLAGYVRGTFLIACFHGVVIGTSLLGLGTPLVAPLALLVFLGSFLPIVGAVIFGGVAVLVTLITQGLVPAIILVVVLVIENQIEAHLLQPFLVGRYVRLHPLAVVLVITGGGLLYGIYGAILAVPFVSAAYAVAECLVHSSPSRETSAEAGPDAGAAGAFSPSGATAGGTAVPAGRYALENGHDPAAMPDAEITALVAVLRREWGHRLAVEREMAAWHQQLLSNTTEPAAGHAVALTASASKAVDELGRATHRRVHLEHQLQVLCSVAADRNLDTV